MKKLALLAILTCSMVIRQETRAQIRFNVNLNIGSQPAWGPVGYDRVDYYYLPDIDAYYNVPQRQFIYLEGNRWIFAGALPSRYRGYNLYNGYKVVVNEPKPYLRANDYRIKYERYKGGRGPSQEMIRDSHDEKYRNNHGNKEHENNGRKEGKGKGRGRD